jgi:hypothetical protein
VKDKNPNRVKVTVSIIPRIVYDDIPQNDVEDGNKEDEEGKHVADKISLRKARWRKKRYFILKQIQQMTVSKPPLAAEKASQTMERWWDMCNKLEQLQQQQHSRENSVKDIDVDYF